MKTFLKPQFNGFGLLAALLLAGSTAIAGTPLSVVATAQSGSASEVVLKADHPDRYTVVKGDTLWDISGMFLRDPWLWPEIWSVNPQIENPHLIYPGDVLTLVWVDGKPQLQLSRGAQQASLGEKMSPGVRVSDSAAPVMTIPFDRISAFLSRAGVASKKELEGLPYIAALRNAMVAGAGDEVYVRELEDAAVGESYRVIRMGEKVVDPETGKTLGYEVIYVGEGTIETVGETSKLLLNDTTREAKEGDRVVRVETLPPANFYPRAPEDNVNGQIVSVKDGVSRIGQYQMVIINRGVNDGMEQGHVLSIWKLGQSSNDRYSRTMSNKFTLPDERVGLLMVLKPEEKTSYALVMDAYSEIRVNDRVRNP